jgi:hypothetical protein
MSLARNLFIGVISFVCILVISLSIVYALIVLSRHHPTYDPGKPPLSSAKPLIEALDTYRNSTGKYPETLDRLVPEYLETIPTPKWGKNEWKYEKTDWDSYALEVRRYKDGYEGYYYYNSPNSWVYDQ